MVVAEIQKANIELTNSLKKTPNIVNTSLDDNNRYRFGNEYRGYRPMYISIYKVGFALVIPVP